MADADGEDLIRHAVGDAEAVPKGRLGESFCESAHDMRKYRRLMMSCVNASSMSDAPDAMMASAANCPAEVTFRAESTEASNTESPMPAA